MKRSLTVLICSSLLLSLVGCEAKKSSNPLSPSIAGPIAGVDITAPRPLKPNGETVLVQSQPVTLIVANALTSGVRPVSYLFEVAVDAGFTNIVLNREAIPAGEGGHTDLRLPDALAPERTYYWRARAEDGANTGPFSDAARFDVVTPVVIEAPALVFPGINISLDTLRPRFTIANARRSGPAGPITYLFQVATNQAFTDPYSFTVSEQPNQTSFDPPDNAAYSTIYYWRVRASDPNNVGPWSETRAFRTPDPPPPPPPPPTPGPPPPNPAPGHVPPGPLTQSQAEKVVYATESEFSYLLGVFNSDGEAEANDEEFLLRTIWHLELYGFQADRQRNPSGVISKDKLCILIDGAWRSFDIMSMGYAGHATSVVFIEVWPANPIADRGIPD